MILKKSASCYIIFEFVHLKVIVKVSKSLAPIQHFSNDRFEELKGYTTMRNCINLQMVRT